jgi:hypothetical protein
MYCSADIASLEPDPNLFLALPEDEQARLLLKLLAPATPENSVSYQNFFNRANDFMIPPKYGSQRQKNEIDPVLMEAWSWSERRGYLTKSPNGLGAWVFVSKAGKDFLNNIPAQQDRKPGELTFIAENRLEELRSLSSSEFDFKKLIRLCEELNVVYRERCYFATAMLTRGVLDHVPPLLGKTTFIELANNYAGGGKSFKEAMHHLDSAARKVADATLHIPIRKSEMLPVAQQVNCAQQLDLLLSEIVRVAK